MYQQLRIFLLAFTCFALLMAMLPQLPRRVASLLNRTSPSTASPHLGQLRIQPPEPGLIHADAIQPLDHSVANLGASPRDGFLVQPAALEQAVPQDSNLQNVTLQDMEQQLLQCGAKSIVLEQRQHQFHCHCLVPIEVGSPFEKPFVAEAPQATQAMQQVLEQIVLWRAGNAAAQ
jgi:hypothetical protein